MSQGAHLASVTSAKEQVRTLGLGWCRWGGCGMRDFDVFGFALLRGGVAETFMSPLSGSKYLLSSNEHLALQAEALTVNPSVLSG